MNFQIVGTVRDVAHVLFKEFKHIESVFKNFGQVRTFLVESDSKDKTLDILRTLSSGNENFEFLTCGQLQQKIQDRYARIAYCREQYLNYVRNSTYIADYVVVADLDGMNSGLSMQSIKNSFNRDVEWDAVFANQLDRYYDVGALRNEYWAPNDSRAVYEWALKVTDEKNARMLAIQSRMIRLNSNAGLIPVMSAYGGLGIYKRNVFIEGSYIGFDSDGKSILDFVNFNQILSNKNYKLYIDSQLINHKISSHTASKFFTFKFLRLISKKIPSNYYKSKLKQYVIFLIDKWRL